MRIIRMSGAIALVTGTALAAAVAQGGMPAGVSIKAGGDGEQILVDRAGMALYTFAKDAGSTSACDASCARTWHPLAAGDDASPTGAWTVVSSSEGSKMWAYKGKPLYTCTRDHTPGSASCEAGDWKVAVP